MTLFDTHNNMQYQLSHELEFLYGFYKEYMLFSGCLDGKAVTMSVGLDNGSVLHQRPSPGHLIFFPEYGIGVGGEKERIQKNDKVCIEWGLEIFNLCDLSDINEIKFELGSSWFMKCFALYEGILYIKGRIEIYRYDVNTNKLLDSLPIESEFGTQFTVSDNKIYIAGDNNPGVYYYDATDGHLLGQRHFDCHYRPQARFHQLDGYHAVAMANFTDDHPEWCYDRLLIWEGDELFTDAPIEHEPIQVRIDCERDANGDHQYRLTPEADFGAAIRHLAVALEGTGQTQGLFDMNPDKTCDRHFAGLLIADCRNLSPTPKQRQRVVGVGVWRTQYRTART